MPYFPEPVFRNITSYLLDPEFYKKRHAKVWQTIEVHRIISAVIVVEEISGDVLNTNTVAEYVIVSKDGFFTNEECHIKTDAASFKCQHTRRYDKATLLLEYWNDNDEDIDYNCIEYD